MNTQLLCGFFILAFATACFGGTAAIEYSCYNLDGMIRVKDWLKTELGRLHTDNPKLNYILNQCIQLEGQSDFLESISFDRTGFDLLA